MRKVWNRHHKRIRKKGFIETNYFDSWTAERSCVKGVGLADKMELDIRKLKYKQNLQDNGSINNKKIGKSIKDLEEEL